MANEENLRTLSPKQAREQGRKGGLASGKARRRKRELKELLEIALSQPNEETGEDNWTAMTVALVQKAIAGDVKAFETIRDTIGQKPVDKMEMQNTDITVNITGDAE